PLSVPGRAQQVGRLHQAAQLISRDQHDVLGTATVDDNRLTRGNCLVAEGREMGTRVTVGRFGGHADPPVNCTGTLYRLGEPGQWLGSPGPAGRMGLTMPQLLRLLRCIGPTDIEVPLPRGLLALLLQPGEVRATVAAVAILGPLRVDGMLQLSV